MSRKPTLMKELFSIATWEYCIITAYKYVVVLIKNSKLRVIYFARLRLFGQLGQFVANLRALSLQMFHIQNIYGGGGGGGCHVGYLKCSVRILLVAFTYSHLLYVSKGRAT